MNSRSMVHLRTYGLRGTPPDLLSCGIAMTGEGVRGMVVVLVVEIGSFRGVHYPNSNPLTLDLNPKTPTLKP